jgi:membrane protease YdiL (CAAX protease family)
MGASSLLESPIRGWARLSSALIKAPEYPPSADDLRTVSLAGLRVPLRASAAILLFAALVVLDYNRTFFPAAIPHDQSPTGVRAQAIDRAILFGLVPLLVILIAFRDRPGRYGLRIGDWRLGIPLAVLGCAIMIPVVLGAAGIPEFQAYYGQSATSLPELALTNVLDVASAEFLFRGFLMFALIRAVGPIGVLLVMVPFVFTHLSKPDVETLSTLAGGLAFGWLNWRTGSILYSAAAHAFIFTLLVANSTG